MRSIINYNTFHLSCKKIRLLITHLPTAASLTKQDNKKETKEAGAHTYILLLHKLWECELLTALCIIFALFAIAFNSVPVDSLLWQQMLAYTLLQSRKRAAFPTLFSLQYITSSQTTLMADSNRSLSLGLRLPNQISCNWTINHI